MTKRGLGKGLGALIPSTEGTEAAAAGLRQVPVDAILPNPLQPRQKQDPDALQELADSIREHGLIQPLIVTEATSDQQVGGAQFQLIAGERRWRAARLAGETKVPVIIKDVAPQEMLELALVENVQRADLNPLEEAMAYRQLIDEFGLTQEQAAERVGKSRVAVTNTLRLLRAPEAVQKALLAGDIREGHARALLTLETDEAQEAALAVVLKQGLNVRQSEALVRRLAGEHQERPAPPPPEPQTQALETAFREALGTRVSLTRSGEGGRIVIHFYSEEELDALYERIVGREE